MNNEQKIRETLEVIDRYSSNISEGDYLTICNNLRDVREYLLQGNRGTRRVDEELMRLNYDLNQIQHSLLDITRRHSLLTSRNQQTNEDRRVVLLNDRNRIMELIATLENTFQ